MQHTAVDSPLLPPAVKSKGEGGGNKSGGGEKDESEGAALVDAVAAAAAGSAAAAGVGGVEGVVSAAELVGLHVPNRTHLWLQSTVPIG